MSSHGSSGWRDSATRILDPSSTPGETLSACQALYQSLGDITGVHDADGLSAKAGDASDTHLPQGMALSAIDAGRCLLDFKRTHAFALGVVLAIEEAQRRFPDTSIRLLYAGCGPFATLFLPLATRFSPSEIQVTLVDIHPQVLAYATNVLQQLGLGDYLDEAILGNLAQPLLPPRSFHVAVTETMQRALDKEPQVAISAQLDKTLHENGILVPEQITLSVELVALGSEFGDGDRQRLPVAPLFDLSRPTLPQISKWITQGASPPKEFELPPTFDPDLFTGAMLCTRIVTFGDLSLGDYDSGLTGTKLIPEVRMEPSSRYAARYRFGEHPGLEISPA